MGSFCCLKFVILFQTSNDEKKLLISQYEYHKCESQDSQCLGFENAMGKAHFQWSRIGYFYEMSCFILKLKRRTRLWWLSGIPLKSIQLKRKLLMVSGLWIQNVAMQKMKLFMLTYQQQLSSNSLILVKQWKIKGNLFYFLLFSISLVKVSQWQIMKISRICLSSWSFDLFQKKLSNGVS